MRRSVRHKNREFSRRPGMRRQNDVYLIYADLITYISEKWTLKPQKKQPIWTMLSSFVGEGELVAHNYYLVVITLASIILFSWLAILLKTSLVQSYWITLAGEFMKDTANNSTSTPWEKILGPLCKQHIRIQLRKRFHASPCTELSKRWIYKTTPQRNERRHCKVHW